MTHAPAIAMVLLSAWVQSSPEREIAAWSVLRGVPVKVALAVHEVETGNVPEGVDDVELHTRAVSRVCERPSDRTSGVDATVSALWCRASIHMHLRTNNHRRGEDNRVRAWKEALRGLHTLSGLRSDGKRPRLGEDRNRKATRDTVISRGNVGRFQVNATAWCPILRLPRAACVRALQNRHTNIAVGIAILSRMRAKFGHKDLTRCACGGRHSWVGHYNAGTLVQAGARGERYGARVVYKVRKMGGHEGW